MQVIAICWSEEVSEGDAILAVRTVEELLLNVLELWQVNTHVVQVPEIKPYGYWVLQGTIEGNPYSSLQWYIDRSLDREKQEIRARKWLHLVLNEPWQQQDPHYDFSLFHHPLFDEEQGQRVFGLSLPGRIAAVSLAPLDALRSDEQRAVALRRLVAHYMGQAFGIPIPHQRDSQECNNVCTMRPSRNLSEWVALAEEEASAQVLYCEECQRELGARFASYHFGLN